MLSFSDFSIVGQTHLHDLVLEGGEEEVDDLVLLDGERVEVDLLHGLDLAGLYETTELGDGLPLLLLALCAATGATTATASTATVTAALSTTTGSESTSVGHFDCVVGMSGGLVVIGVVVVTAENQIRGFRQVQLRNSEWSSRKPRLQGSGSIGA